MNQDQDTREIWADVRRRWNEDDLPVLLAKAGDAVVERLAHSVIRRKEAAE